MLRPDGGRRSSRELRELAQRLAAWREAGEFVVVLNVLDEFLVLGFPTEILPVRFDSIEAVIRPGDYGG